MGDFRAIIFDMDGVLVDSEPLFFNAVNLLLEREGGSPVSEEENRINLIGTTVEETWRRLAKMRNLTRPLPYYLENYDGVVRQVLREQLVPRPGVTHILEAARQRGLPTAVASSSLRSWVELKLEALKLDHTFNAVLGGDDVARGKPEPDIYLTASQRLGVPPSECIAIEDSPIGIAAAVASGIYTIAVRTKSTDGLDISQAHAVLDSLTDFDLSLLIDAAS